MKLTRFSGNPIIIPSRQWWEVQATFNPGATIFEGKTLLLYRAIGGDGLSRFGKAISSDGFNFERFPDPILEADIKDPLERLGIEDPRITNIEGEYYVTYTAASVYSAQDYKDKGLLPSLNHPAPWKIRPTLIITKDFKNFERKGILLDKETKDAVLFPEKFQGRFCLLHRVYPNILITFSSDLKNWSDEKVLISPRADSWDSERVGAGVPPIKTEKGWLLFYHGADDKHVYKIGLMLLDLSDPTKVLYRSEEALLTPEEDYEKIGLTANVVFTCGAIEKDDTYFVYYGAGDRVIALATLPKGELEF